MTTLPLCRSSIKSFTTLGNQPYLAKLNMDTASDPASCPELMSTHTESCRNRYSSAVLNRPKLETLQYLLGGEELEYIYDWNTLR